ncbi:MAG TPA: hypothetical protein VE262_02740 [Blastocatellia bacterium]|nr:hypothetical protein [Blastocatellia bacterium]
MGNTKPKPEEAARRSPGKSKFVFPKREAPPVDNTYFDRLFSELQEQNQVPEASLPVDKIPFPDQTDSNQETQNQANLAVLDIEPDTHLSPVVANLEAAALDIKRNQAEEPAASITLNQASIDPTDMADPVLEQIKTKQPTLIVATPAGGSVKTSQPAMPVISCKLETSIYVDGLKLKYRLSKGEANVLKYLLGATHDQAKTACYITIPKLAEAVNLTARGCQLTLKSLQTRGFILRIEEYDPSSRLGIKLQVNLTPV